MGNFTGRTTNHGQYCWQCTFYGLCADDPIPPQIDDRAFCSVSLTTRSAYAKICPSGRRDQGRWQAYLAIKKAGEEDRPEKPTLSDYPEALQRCVAACKPKTAYYVKTSATGLSKTEIEELVKEGYLKRYERKPSGCLYRLAGKYHHLVEVED
jgi:hypothetical protein